MANKTRKRRKGQRENEELSPSTIHKDQPEKNGMSIKSNIVTSELTGALTYSHDESGHQSMEDKDRVEQNGRSDMNRVRVEQSSEDFVHKLVSSAIVLESDESEEPEDGFLTPKILNVCSLAPTAEEEEFEFDENEEMQLTRNLSRLHLGRETVIDIGEEESILGLDYPQDDFLAFGMENMGHFLTGGGGLDSLTYSSHPESSDGTENLPPLANCSTIWDGIIHLCEIEECSIPATSKCSFCKRAFYCGEDHQTMDWQRHRGVCIPFREVFVRHHSSDGLPVTGMVATRELFEGQDLFSEKPLLLFPLASSTDSISPLECEGRADCRALVPACFGCTKEVEYVGPRRHRCSTCSLPLCSQACEYEFAHKLGECQAIIEAGLLVNECRGGRCYHGLYMDVEILRALRLHREDETQWESFYSLRKSIRVENYKRSERFEAFRLALDRLVPLSAKYADFDNDLIETVHAIIAVCAFKPSLRSTYKVIFSRQLQFLHDCKPNTVHYVENEESGDPLKIRLVMKAAICIFREQSITVDHLPSPYLLHRERRALLRHLAITCRCTRCVNPTGTGDNSGTMKCLNCRNGYVMAEEPLKWENSVWACDRCQEECSYKMINETECGLVEELENIPKTYESIPRLCEFLEKGLTKLHPSHSIRIAAWCFVESLLRRKLQLQREPDIKKRYTDQTYRDFQLMIEYANLIEPHLDAVRQGCWLDKGILLFQKFYSEFVLTSKDFQEDHIDRQQFTKELFKCLSTLQKSLHILCVFEGMNSLKYMDKLLQEATATYATLKDFIANFIKPAPKSNPSTTL